MVIVAVIIVQTLKDAIANPPLPLKTFKQNACRIAILTTTVQVMFSPCLNLVNIPIAHFTLFHLVQKDVQKNSEIPDI